ncbi:MAG: TVP38/TMEM64 family protein [Caulobacteraceae bacterium]
MVSTLDEQAGAALDAMSEDGQPYVVEARTARRRLKRVYFRNACFAVLAIAVLVGLMMVASRYFSFEELKLQRDRLEGFVHVHRVTAVVAYLLLYIAVVAFSLPGALIMTMTGGFLFGVPQGSVAAVVGSSTGAVLMYLMARSALGDFLRKWPRIGGFIRRLEEHAHHDAFAYILTLRLIPAMPFWLVNIAAGCVRIPLSTYWSATVIGIAPSTVIYAGVGAGLGKVFDHGGKAGVHLLLQPQVLWPLIGLVVLAIAPLVWSARRARRRAAAKPPA